MNASGIIETGVNFNSKAPPRKMIETIEAKTSVPDAVIVRNSPAQILKKKLSTPVLPSQKVVLSYRSNSDLGLKNLKSFPLHKSKSLENDKGHEKYSRLCESRSVTPSPPPPQVPLLNLQKNSGKKENQPRGLSPIPDRSPTEEDEDCVVKSERPRLLNIPGLLFIGKKPKSELLIIENFEKKLNPDFYFPLNLMNFPH